VSHVQQLRLVTIAILTLDKPRGVKWHLAGVGDGINMVLQKLRIG
jgi:hypothetical protein